MKFLIVETSPLSILIPLGPKKFASGSRFHSSLNVKDHVSQPYSTTGNNNNYLIFYMFLIDVFERSKCSFFLSCQKQEGRNTIGLKEKLIPAEVEDWIEGGSLIQSECNDVHFRNEDCTFCMFLSAITLQSQVTASFLT